jgi:hypothetical protein
LPAHDAQKSFDRGIVEISLQPDVNGRPMARTHLFENDSRHCEKRGEGQARKGYLETNHVLTPAIRSYESLGFKHIDANRIVPSLTG